MGFTQSQSNEISRQNTGQELEERGIDLQGSQGVGDQ